MSAVIDKAFGSELKIPVRTTEKFVSIIIPVYNEEKYIGTVISEIQEIMFNTNLQYEVIVVDDGSTDKSSEKLECMNDIILIKHPHNIGYGGALKTGLRKAKGELIVITDADGTYPNEKIPQLIGYMNENDMVVGARSMSNKNISTIRKPAKWLLSKLANYLSETNIPDLNSGLRIFKKNIALQFYKLFPSGFSFTTTITLAMHVNGFNVKYVPIEYNKREGRSKIRPIRDTLNFIQLISRTIMYFNPLRIFIPISIIIFFSFLISCIYDISYHNLTDKTIIFFLAYIQVSIIGLLADLIDKRSSYTIASNHERSFN